MLSIIQADLTTLAVDAIVNAANHTLLGGGGVDGAIHRAAGPELRAYCQTLKGCETAVAKLTPGFKLGAPWIIHTVGPVWAGGSQDEDATLADCYEHCLRLALKHDLASIAFPAISTGVYGFPKARAARIASQVMRRYQHQFERIIACCHHAEDLRFYQQVL